jgi:exodeoxyribonuclease VII large subunit
MTTNDLFSAAEKAEKTPPSQKLSASAPNNVLDVSVSDLAQGLKKTLEEIYGHVRVRGELSGLKIAGSGHLYGDIKDENANINIICWRGTLSHLPVKPEDGMDVILTGKVSSYPKSSRYQIIVERLELAGRGALLQILEERKRKLAAEGLFSAERKKRLPFLPNSIGVITSPTGAVIRDILHRVQDRFPRHVIVWPVAVQGDGAAEQVTKAIEGFNRLPASVRPDLLIVARGGGSLEDLMAFNEENVVRAVAASAIPVISAVGHETDTTLCDYAADLRAPTPTGAAEMAVPVREQLILQIDDDTMRLKRALWRQLKEYRAQIANLSRHLGQPERLFETRQQQMDHISQRLQSAGSRLTEKRRAKLAQTSARLTRPDQLIVQKRTALHYAGRQIENFIKQSFEQKKQRLTSTGRMIESLSPKSVLKRGYAILRDEQDKLIQSPDQAQPGQKIIAELAEGQEIRARVEK